MTGTGGMAQWLRALVIIPEDPRLILRTTEWLTTTHVTPVPKDPMPSSGLYGHQACTHDTDIHAYA